MGASSHSGKNKRGTKNIKSSGSQSQRHTGKTVEALNTMGIARQFIGKDVSTGMKATLTDVNYNSMYNFNLVILTRLLMNGWKVTKGDKTGITVGSKDGSEIKFDIVIPTVCGAIFACRFI